MQTVYFLHGDRHAGLRKKLSAWFRGQGWNATDEGAAAADAVVLIADAQSWEADGLRDVFETLRGRGETSRVFLLWVGGAPLPWDLPAGGWASGWTGGTVPPAVEAPLKRFLSAAPGRGIDFETSFGSPTVSQEGATVAREIELEDAGAPSEEAPPPPSPAMAAPAAPARPQGDERDGPEPDSEEAPTGGGETSPPQRRRFAHASPPSGDKFRKILKSSPDGEEAAAEPVPSEDKQAGAESSEEAAPCFESEADAPAPLSAETGPPAAREVRTSVFCEEQLTKGRWFTLQVWLHLPEQKEEVRQMARESGHDSQVGRKAGLRIAPGSLVGFTIRPEVLSTKRSRFGRRRTLHRWAYWEEEPTNVAFPVCCPKNFRDEVLYETIEISVEGIPIGTSTVTLAFDRTGELVTHFSQIRTAFASYSSQDREFVIGRLQMLEAAVGLKAFFDVDSLRMGEDWEQRLIEEVPTKDKFLLFWSDHARKSEWVEREWRLALAKKGIDYILPVPLRPAPPPKELRKLQFSDRYARMADYERLKREEERARADG